MICTTIVFAVSAGDDHASVVVRTNRSIEQKQKRANRTVRGRQRYRGAATDLQSGATWRMISALLIGSRLRLASKNGQVDVAGWMRLEICRKLAQLVNRFRQIFVQLLIVNQQAQT